MTLNSSGPYIIGIAGESGVGKTTIADVIELYYGTGNVTRISTDDLHKWERSDVSWKNITHVNPNANNLDLGDWHLSQLSIGNPIYRSRYNHSIGKFDPPNKIYPQKYIINEGLHAYYTTESSNLCNLKIYVDTSENLKLHWKLIRDVEERGYNINDVMDTINRRKPDEGPVRKTQTSQADVIIKFFTNDIINEMGVKNQFIDVRLEYNFNKHWVATIHKDLLEFIQQYYKDFNDFIRYSIAIGKDIDLVQGSGGNTSIKLHDDSMIIKASGYNLKDIHILKGYSLLHYKSVNVNWQSGNIQDNKTLKDVALNSIIKNKYKAPSMEFGMHTTINEKYIIHTHPIYVNILLCLVESKELISKLYTNLVYKYIDYCNPGYDLLEKINNNKGYSIYFLENHGLVVSANNMNDAYEYTIEINNVAKEFLKRECVYFEDFGTHFSDFQTYLFPDDVIFSTDDKKTEISAASNYIKFTANQLGKIRYLTNDDVNALKNNELEKHRRTI